MLNSNKGYQGLVHPMVEHIDESGQKKFMPDFTYRYMTEDRKT